MNLTLFGFVSYHLQEIFSFTLRITQDFSSFEEAKFIFTFTNSIYLENYFFLSESKIFSKTEIIICSLH